ncbi:MAG: c-type cytochrome [Vicinamibacterales bacterium]
MAVLAATGAVWLFGRPLPEVEQQRRHFAELQRQVALADASKTARAADRARLMRLRAQSRTANGGERERFDAEVQAIDSRLGWRDTLTVRSAVHATPFIALRRYAVVDGFSDIDAERGNGCLACHVSAASSGFATYPAPFRTHSRFASYVGAASPHPPSRVACVSCHGGDAHASTFAAAGHARPFRIAAGAPAVGRAWNDPSAAGAMRPVAHTEAGCVSCHLGERYQPGATALHDALLTFERAGCAACHRAPGMERDAKRGPDLRRVKGKLTPEWVRRWLADPRAMKPATWMPAFWPGRDALTLEDRAAIDAITTYLFANSEAYAPVVLPSARGDAARGKIVVESRGCLGCHITGSVEREAASLRRTFGPPLQAIGAKTTDAWLFDWLRDPTRYSPDTRMPNLRLTAVDVADVAAYLQSLTSASDAPRVDPPEGDQAYRAVMARYDVTAAAAGATTLTGDALRMAAGRAAIDALGCFNCHEVRGFEARTTTVRMQQRQDWNEGAIVALFGVEDRALRDVIVEGIRPHPGPGYRLGPKERARLALALTALSGRTDDAHALTTPWHLAKVKGRALMQARNCVGCHSIDGVGGDVVSLVADPALGPPPLTSEIARLPPAQLRAFLEEPRTSRPGLSVHIPTFNLSGDDIEIVDSYVRSLGPEGGP